MSDTAPRPAVPHSVPLDEAAELMRVMGHPIRLALIEAIGNQELSVGEIETVTAVAQPTLSQQLAVLRKADMVTTRRQAKQIFYRLNPARLESITCFMCRLAGQLGITPAGVRAPTAEASNVPVPQKPAPSNQSNGVAMFARVERTD